MPDEVLDSPPVTHHPLVGAEVSLPVPAGGATAIKISDINLSDETFSWQFGDFIPSEDPDGLPVFCPAKGWQGSPFTHLPEGELTADSLAAVVSGL